MHSQSVLLSLGLAWLASAVPTPAPLNINLGAYSPALVVGDGAISFAGAEGAAKAATAVKTAKGAEGAQVIDSEAGTSQVTVGEAVTPVQQTPALVQDTTLLQGMGKQRLPKD